MYNYGRYQDDFYIDPAYADDLENLFDVQARAAGRPAGAAAGAAAAAPAGATAPKSSKLGGFFNKFKNKAGGAVGAAADVVGDSVSNVMQGKGIVPKWANYANLAMGGMAAANAAKGLSDYGNARRDTDSLVSDILASAAGNPNLRYDLSNDQLATLRKLQNGTYDLSGDFDANSLLGNLGNIATGAGLGFVTGGGPVGAILGGLGGAVDGITSGMVGNQNQITADLEGLYQALYESEMANKAMKRDAAKMRYANSLY